MDLERFNGEPATQNIVIDQRLCVMECSNNCWRKLSAREISSKHAISNQSRRIKLFSDFHLQDYYCKDCHNRASMCVTDHTVFITKNNGPEMTVFELTMFYRRKTNTVNKLTFNTTES